MYVKIKPLGVGQYAMKIEGRAETQFYVGNTSYLSSAEKEVAVLLQAASHVLKLENEKRSDQVGVVSAEPESGEALGRHLGQETAECLGKAVADADDPYKHEAYVGGSFKIKIENSEDKEYWERVAENFPLAQITTCDVKGEK